VTPVPFELPLRPNEAAAIADLLFQQCEGKPLTEDQRGRFAGRLATIETPSVTVFPGSLAADPVHGSSYFVAGEGGNNGALLPLLLRIALASAAATGFYPKSLMIGRVRPVGQREVVISAVPFGPDDHEHVRTFVENIDKSFLPRAHGAQPTHIVRTARPGEDLPAVFESFRQLPKQTHVAVEVSSYWTAVWAAIRAGRRESYSVGTVIEARAGREAALRQVEERPLFTKYVIECGGAEDATAVIDHVRRVKSGLAHLYPRTVDFEVALADAAEIPAALAALKAEGRAVQAVSAKSVTWSDALTEALRVANLPIVLDAELPNSPVRVSLRKTLS